MPRRQTACSPFDRFSKLRQIGMADRSFERRQHRLERLGRYHAEPFDLDSSRSHDYLFFHLMCPPGHEEFGR